MKSGLSKILAHLYVGFYVVFGYCRYAFNNIGKKTIIVTVSTMLMLIGFALVVIKPDPSISGNDALNKGYDLQNRGKENAAHSAFEDAYLFYEEKQDSRAMLYTMGLLGDSDLSLNKHGEALQHYLSALRLAQSLNLKKNQINLLAKSGDVQSRTGRTNEARVYYNDALTISQDIKSFDDTAALYMKLGNLERDIVGNDAPARHAYQNAQNIYADHSNALGEATLHWNIGVLESRYGNYDASLSSFVLARDYFKTSGDVNTEAIITKHMARLEKKYGSLDNAETYYSEAATLFASIGENDALKQLKQEAGQPL